MKKRLSGVTWSILKKSAPPSVKLPALILAILLLCSTPLSTWASPFCITHGMIPPTTDPNPLYPLLISLIGKTSNSFTLTPRNRFRYKKIFALQHQGNWEQADKHIARLDDKRLIGHVLFQRYMHPTHYRSTHQELISWLELYSDHPGVERVERLARRRAPVRAPDRPASPPAPLTASQEIFHTITQLLSSNQLPQALQTLDQKSPELTSIDYEKLLLTVSYLLYHHHSFEKALDYIARSIDRQSHNLDQAYKIAGLSAWRLHRFEQALAFFQAMNHHANSPQAASFARFWSAKALFKLGKPTHAQQWLEKAGKLSRTFYGFMAQVRLNRPHDFSWQIPSLTQAHILALLGNPNFQRAALLIQIQQFDRAEQDLIQSALLDDDPILKQALLIVAIKGKLPRLALSLGTFDPALYPQVHWQPADRYRVDKALLYGLIRQESRFQNHARSTAGAIGLMQLMPATAQWISQKIPQLSFHDVYTPQANLTFGQWYLSYLLNHRLIKRNLIMLLAAYNAGPGNLKRWQKHLSALQDPLLFIESLPFKETRHFIRQVLLNYWIYQSQFQQSPCSASSLAHGHWPAYRVLLIPGEKPRDSSFSIVVIQSLTHYR